MGHCGWGFVYLFRAPRHGILGLVDRFLSAGDESPAFPTPAWMRRHLGLAALLAFHAGTIVVLSKVLGYGNEHGLLEGLVPVVAVAMALLSTRARTEAAGWVAVGFFASFIVFLHLVEGALWMNLHFALVLAVLAVYRSWTTVAAGFATIVIQHGVLAVTDPHSVYGHDGAGLAPLIIAAQFAALVTVTWWITARSPNAARVHPRTDPVSTP